MPLENCILTVASIRGITLQKVYQVQQGHLAHIVTLKTRKKAPTPNHRHKMIYKIKHNLVEDITFLEKIQEAYSY